MLDVLIRNSLVVDGTGAPGRRAAIGMRGGRIVTAAAGESARRSIDADGLVLAPGFVDIHTHYDAQLDWDATASPSLQHGVTTIIGGNCGFSIAPLRQDMAGYIMRMLAVVEGIPLESLQAALDWDWDSFGSWLQRFEGRIAVNAGFFAGHSAIRVAVMGHEGLRRVADAGEIARMKTLLAESLAAGAMGFSTSLSLNHLDGEGQPVPSRAAAPGELLELCSVLQGYPGTSVQIAPAGSSKGFEAAEVELMVEMSRRAGRPINWNLLHPNAANTAFTERQLAPADAARSGGARIAALCLPAHSLRVSFASSMPLNSLPGWAPVFALDLPARRRALSDPEVRRQLRAAEQVPQLGSRAKYVRWGAYRIAEGFSPQVRRHEGRVIDELAHEAGTDPFDTLIDLVIADDLRTGLIPEQPDQDAAAWRERVRVWRDPRVVLGGSDAGAHLDLMCSGNYTARLIAGAVRERALMSMEEAVRLLTDVPARFYGLASRGRIADGWQADLVLFDPAAIGSSEARVTEDLPGGAKRLLSAARGIRQVFVNGREVLADGEPTGQMGGQVLRGGRDTCDTSI